MPGAKADLGSKKNSVCWVKTEKSRGEKVHLLILDLLGVACPSWDDQSQALELPGHTAHETSGLPCSPKSCAEEKEPVSGVILVTLADLALGQMEASKRPAWCH